jgi:hypothetical protein
MGSRMACDQISAAEKGVDIICLSPSGMLFDGAVCMLFSPILSTFHIPNHGTKEEKIDEGDVGLGNKWEMVAVVNHTTLSTSLAFDYPATNNSHITILHFTSDLVKTCALRLTRYPSKADGLGGPLSQSCKLFWELAYVMLETMSAR